MIGPGFAEAVGARMVPCAVVAALILLATGFALGVVFDIV
jgi:hypothetical protein